MLFRVLSAVGFVALCSGVAVAADLAPTPQGTLPESSAFDWTGLYVGGNVAYTSTTSNAVFINAPLDAIAIPQNESGFTGGLVLGYNQQVDSNFVLGIEGGFNAGDIGATYADPLIGFPGGPAAGNTVTAGSDYSGQLLLRGGVSIGNVLPYVTGGVAAAHIHTTATAGGADDNGIFTGWAAGAGIEIAMDNHWSTNVQYLHTALTGPNFNVGKSYETSATPDSDSVRLGINYRF